MAGVAVTTPTRVASAHAAEVCQPPAQTHIFAPRQPPQVKPPIDAIVCGGLG